MEPSRFSVKAIHFFLGIDVLVFFGVRRLDGSLGIFEVRAGLGGGRDILGLPAKLPLLC